VKGASITTGSRKFGGSRPSFPSTGGRKIEEGIATFKVTFPSNRDIEEDGVLRKGGESLGEKRSGGRSGSIVEGISILLRWGKRRSLTGRKWNQKKRLREKKEA